MDSNTHHNLHPQELQNHQPNSGLLRFRSAPSSLFANFAENGDRGVSKGNPIEGAGSESERLFSRFVNYSNNCNDSDSWPSSFQEFDDKSTVMASPMSSQQQQRYSHSGLPPHYPRQSSYGATGNGSYGLVGSAAVDHQTEAKTVHSNLVRQSSSPAGLFHHNSVQNGAGYGLNSTDGELNPSTNRWKGQNSFSLRLPSSLGMLPQISDIGSECIGANSPDNGKLGNGNADTRFNGTGFPFGTWNDPSNFADNLGGMRRDQDNDEKLFSVAQNGGELGNRIHILSHHLSLPKTSAEIAMEKFLQLQDSVPCKVRAKRGCATHPRSIAERVRRTRISERMRKLQELVPNMDKQTNTADMLDLAVEYIKDLQKQFKTLNDIRANCKCLKVQKPVSNQIV